MSRELTTGPWHNDAQRHPFPPEPRSARDPIVAPVYTPPSASAALNKLKSVLQRPRPDPRPFDALEQAELLRALWTCVWLKPEWRQYFHVTDEQTPRYEHLEEWVMDHEADTGETDDEMANGQGSSSGYGGRGRWVKPWRLQDAQEETRSGQRSPFQADNGACGKVLKRYDRTYVCL